MSHICARKGRTKGRTRAQLARGQVLPELPPAALQVLKHAPTSPFSALGVERLAEARSLNAVNRKYLLKKYRKLALELHPDRCDHCMAVDAMQALNAAFDKVMPQARA